MRTFDEKDESDVKDAAELNAEPWMLDLVKLNEHYVHWGCFEDYMWREDAGWETRTIIKTFSEVWGLDDLNECVNYYFDITRDNEKCVHCDGAGYNPETKKISDTFYDFKETGGRWSENITQDEVEALVAGGRIDGKDHKRYHINEETGKWATWVDSKEIEMEKPEMPTAEEVNAKERKGGLGHDAINRWILIETRAKRLGVWGHCVHCDGNGYIYLTDKAKVGLQLWILHPRKGCSKGIYVEDIKKEDLSAVKEYLLEARSRVNTIFKNIDKI